jgi:hypothetical protein
MLIFSFVPRHPCMAWVIGLLSSFAVATPAMAQAVGSVRLDRLPTLQASQASTPVPPVVYTSVLDDLPKGVETTTLDWKAANANVGQFKRGYADLLKWEQEQADKALKTPKKEVMPAAPTKAGVQP